MCCGIVVLYASSDSVPIILWIETQCFCGEKRYPITQDMKLITKEHTIDEAKYFLIVSAFFSNTITTIATPTTNTTPNAKSTTTTMITIITTLLLLLTN